ncbi:hypothetical protein V1517DRAFT_87585 [Lipomyces orientalis]|uniref:Uncharacterized protein n=1 Tax=Lipomyces orientalis TaxID=1233043 RepID=A0ACC3TSX7_9ASCO
MICFVQDPATRRKTMVVSLSVMIGFVFGLFFAFRLSWLVKSSAIYSGYLPDSRRCYASEVCPIVLRWAMSAGTNSGIALRGLNCVERKSSALSGSFRPLVVELMGFRHILRPGRNSDGNKQISIVQMAMGLVDVLRFWFLMSYVVCRTQHVSGASSL